MVASYPIFLVVTFSIVGGFSILLGHDLYMLHQEPFALVKERMYDRYINDNSCEDLKKEIDSFDKYFLHGPNDVLLDAYRDKEC